MPLICPTFNAMVSMPAAAGYFAWVVSNLCLGLRCNAEPAYSSELRLRIDQSAFSGQRRDLISRKAGLAQNLATMLAQSRRMLPDRRGVLLQVAAGPATRSVPSSDARWSAAVRRPRDAGRRSGCPDLQRRVGKSASLKNSSHSAVLAGLHDL